MIIAILQELKFKANGNVTATCIKTKPKQILVELPIYDFAQELIKGGAFKLKQYLKKDK
jgi:hypothetical protein